MDGIQVVLGALGERKRLSDQAADALAQGAKPTLHVAGFARFFAAATVRSGWKGCPVGPPEIAAGGTTPVGRRQGCPQVTRTLFTAVAQVPGHALASAPTKGHPPPERLRFALHKVPAFIEFEHVAALAG